MQKYFDTVLSFDGKPVAGASVTVTPFGGSTPSPLFSDAAGVTGKGNPLITDGNGYFDFYAADGRYSLEIAVTGYTPRSVTDILLEDPADPSQQTINGGSINNTPIGAVTPSSAAFTTASASGGFTGDLTGNADTATSAERLEAAGFVPISTNGVERARVDTDGNLLVGSTSGSGHVLSKDVAAYGAFVQNEHSAAACGVMQFLLPGRTNDSASAFLYCADAGAARLYILGNGNVQNTNNSYGAISDLKLKENIVDATPKLDKLMQVRVVSYNLKTDPEHKQIGVIAQELEQVFPGMVEETADRDAEGRDLGTATKSVKYSVFVPMLVKAIQEQQAMIEALTARVATLEQAN
jgi:hypothetical protein